MNKFCGLALSMVGSLVSFAANAQNVNECDQLFSQRGPALLKASDCYQNKITAAMGDADTLKLYEMSFISLSLVVNEAPRTSDERASIDAGMKLSQTLSASYPNNANSLYWTAVFTSFNAIALDRGKPIPTHTIGAIRSIQQNLSQAMQLDPRIHFYGPGRVLGIMNSKMPGVVGGDKVLAEKLLREAFQKMPGLSDNHLALARILIINGERDEARSLLNQFIGMSDADLQPFPGQALLSFSAEIATDKQTAKEILEVLNNSQR